MPVQDLGFHFGHQQEEKPVTTSSPKPAGAAAPVLRDPREDPYMLDAAPEALLNLRQAEAVHAAARYSLFCGLIGVVVLGFWLRGALPVEKLAGWAVAAGVVYVARLIQALSFKAKVRGRHWVAGKSLLWFTVGATLSGLLWGGLGVWVATSASLMDTALALALVAVLALAATMAYAAAPAAALGFAWTALLPPAVVLLFAGGPQQTLFGAILIVLGVVLSLGLWVLASPLGRGLRAEVDAQRMQTQVKKLSEDLDKAQLGLKIANQRVSQTSTELNSTFSDLTSTRREIQRLQQQLDETALSDAETELANRTYFEQVLDNEWRRAIRTKRPLTVIVCDLDDFDVYRTVHGEEAASETLKRVATRIKELVNRAGDIAARIEYNKFALVLPATPSKFAGQFGEQLRKAIEDLQIGFNVPQSKRKLLTASIGVSSSIPGPESTHEDLLERINAALYEATFRGGNRVLGYRALDSLRVDRWSEQKEGLVSLEALTHKLNLQGYEVKRQVYPARASLGDQRIEHDSARALFSGQLSLSVEGMEVQLRAGDCVYIPAGSTISTEVTVDQQVVALEGIKKPAEGDF